MSTTDFAIWASMQFVVAGYMVNQIQKEKKSSEVSSTTEDTSQENSTEDE